MSAALSTAQPLGPPLWLTQLERAIRMGDEATFRQALPRRAPHTLPSQLFRDVSPLRAALDTGRADWVRAVLAVTCEHEKAQVLVDLFTPTRLSDHELYRAIWESTDKGVLLQAAIVRSLDDRLLEQLLKQSTRLPGAVYDRACRVAVDQRHPNALEALIRWSRRQPDANLIEYTFGSHDSALQRAVLKRVSDFELGTAVATAAGTGDLGALDQIEAEMTARNLSPARRARDFAQVLCAAIKRADEQLWQWALPRADLDHAKGKALREALGRRCLPWAEVLLARGAKPHVAFRVLRVTNRWEEIALLAKLVTPKRRARWLRDYPEPLASVRAWEREQAALKRSLPTPTRLRRRT